MHPKEGPMEALFTENERQTALAICRSIFDKGQRPRLISKTHDGEFKTLFDYRNVQKKRKPKAA
jgi:hypothetical protein